MAVKLYHVPTRHADYLSSLHEASTLAASRDRAAAPRRREAPRPSTAILYASVLAKHPNLVHGPACACPPEAKWGGEALPTAAPVSSYPTVAVPASDFGALADAKRAELDAATTNDLVFRLWKACRDCDLGAVVDHGAAYYHDACTLALPPAGAPDEAGEAVEVRPGRGRPWVPAAWVEREAGTGLATVRLRGGPEVDGVPPHNVRRCAVPLDAAVGCAARAADPSDAPSTAAVATQRWYEGALWADAGDGTYLVAMRDGQRVRVGAAAVRRARQFSVGDEVLVQWRRSEAQTRCRVAATVVSVSADDGVCTVCHADGTLERDVPEADLDGPIDCAQKVPLGRASAKPPSAREAAAAALGSAAAPLARLNALCRMRPRLTVRADAVTKPVFPDFSAPPAVSRRSVPCDDWDTDLAVGDAVTTVFGPAEVVEVVDAVRGAWGRPSVDAAVVAELQATPLEMAEGSGCECVTHFLDTGVALAGCFDAHEDEDVFEDADEDGDYVEEDEGSYVDAEGVAHHHVPEAAKSQQQQQQQQHQRGAPPPSQQQQQQQWAATPQQRAGPPSQPGRAWAAAPQPGTYSPAAYRPAEAEERGLPAASRRVPHASPLRRARPTSAAATAPEPRRPAQTRPRPTGRHFWWPHVEGAAYCDFDAGRWSHSSARRDGAEVQDPIPHSEIHVYEDRDWAPYLPATTQDHAFVPAGADRPAPSAAAQRDKILRGNEHARTADRERMQERRARLWQ